MKLTKYALVAFILTLLSVGFAQAGMTCEGLAQDIRALCDLQGEAFSENSKEFLKDYRYSVNEFNESLLRQKYGGNADISGNGHARMAVQQSREEDREDWCSSLKKQQMTYCPSDVDEDRRPAKAYKAGVDATQFMGEAMNKVLEVFDDTSPPNFPSDSTEKPKNEMDLVRGDNGVRG